MRPVLLIAALLAACERPPAPPPVDWATEGPGLAAIPYAPDALFTRCAFLDGGPEDADHHNLVAMVDGWLLLPWAPEDGGGGVRFFDVSDPCDPVSVGGAYSPFMRESHTLAIGEVGGRRILAVDTIAEEGRLGGVGFWDITDVTAPTWLSRLDLEGFRYPDSYTRLTLSTTWQGPYLYVSGAFNGVYIVDASDPEHPVDVGRIQLDVPMMAGTFHVVGDLAMYSTAGLSRVVLLDLSDPLAPRPIPGADWRTVDRDGVEHTYYFANLLGRYGAFARNGNGGGPVLYDISDPSSPTWVADDPTDHEGGYVMRQGDALFIGDSDHGVVYDMTDPTSLMELGRVDIPGDLDTVTPLGNALVASVDSGAADGEGSAVFPWRAEPDTAGPVPELVRPADGAVRVAATVRIGVSFDEAIETASVHPGSFRVTDHAGWPIPGTFNVQEGIVNFTPQEPLAEDTTVVVVLPAGGVADVSGNPLSAPLTFRFTTGTRLR